MNKGLLIAGVLIAVAVGVYLFTGKMGPSQKTAASPVPQAEVNEEVATPSAPELEIKSITVSGDQYKYSPSSIELMAGQSTKIVFKNVGTLPHDLVITGLNAKTNVIGGGKEETITVTADKTGTYAFYCSVGNHRQLGMEGTATVK